MNRAHPSTLTARLLRALTLTAVLALGATSCSGDDDGSSKDDSSSSSSEEKQASSALQAGLDAHSKGDLTEAKAQYEKVLDLDSDNKYAFYNLALIDEASKNYGAAEENYRAALEADPAYEPALFNLAILRTSEDPQEAIQLYRAAVKAAPKDAAAWLNLGLLLRASGDSEGGDAAVAEAIKLDPELVDPASN